MYSLFRFILVFIYAGVGLLAIFGVVLIVAAFTASGSIGSAAQGMAGLWLLVCAVGLFMIAALLTFIIDIAENTGQTAKATEESAKTLWRIAEQTAQPAPPPVAIPRAEEPIPLTELHALARSGRSLPIRDQPLPLADVPAPAPRKVRVVADRAPARPTYTCQACGATLRLPAGKHVRDGARLRCPSCQSFVTAASDSPC